MPFAILLQMELVSIGFFGALKKIRFLIFYFKLRTGPKSQGMLIFLTGPKANQRH